MIDIDIKDISGSVLKSVPVTRDCKSYEEVMALCYITLSWDDGDHTILPAGAYIEHGGKTYRLIEPYEPAYVNEASWRYTPKFYDKIALWSKKPLFLVTDSGEETDWSLTAYPGQFMEAVVAAISKYTGETYTYSVDASIAQLSMRNVTFQSVSIFDGLTKIANAWETEWWVSGNVIHLSKCQYGTAITLTVGDNVGIPSVTKNKEGYFTRFYAFGGTRNITQDYNDSGFTNGLVNKRLTLSPTDYPDGYIDIKPNLQQAEIFVKTLIFDEIYPSSSLTISDVRAELRDLLDESGNKIQVSEDAEGNPVYQQYSIWYFKIPGFTFDNSTYDKEDNPDGMLLPGLALSVSFESGQLNRRDFELTYHDDTAEYEINFIKEGTLIVPGTVSLIPADGDKVILYNIKMPEEYTASAQEDLAEALLSEMEKYKQDRNSYTFPSASDKFEEDGLDMSVGQAVAFVHGDKSLSSRVLKVEKQLDFPIEQTITVGEEKIKGNTQEIKEEVIDANQNIDVVKTLADLNKAITDGYGRVQQLIIQSMSQYRGMWILNPNGHPNDPSYWTVETDYTAISRGDIVAKSVDEEIDDAELPKAGYGITNFGLTAIKQGGGLMIDSNNLVYVDPAYAGGGGIDTGELEQYLTSHFYMKKNDPASYLLMTDYAMPETYAPVTSTDTVLTAIGKLERNFGNYVTIATQQTVTGKKTFTQDIIGEADIIAKSASAAIADAELPIASATQLGLIKVGTGFEITADGVLNNTGTGGLTEVYWSDIKYPPTTLAGYGITDAYTKAQSDNLYIQFAGTSVHPIANETFKHIGYAYEADGWWTTGPMISFGSNTGFFKQIQGYFGSNSLKLRTNNNGVFSEWREFAFTDSKVASASKLDPGCKIWGQTFTGEKDITGSLLDVDSITSRSNSFILRVDNDQHILASNSLNNTILNARKGGGLYLGYTSTDSIYFYGGQSLENTTGSRLGHWSIDGLCIGGSSHNAKLHVVGDGLFTGDVIARSTSSAITDTELPIASATQLGLVKIGTGFTITADGVLNNTGGGLSEVYWDQIKETPTTLSGYGITASDVLTTLKTVDGSGSGLDADTLDGTQKTALLTSVTSTSGNNLSVVVGGTTKSVAHLFATNFTPTSIPENANLNSYNIPGMYYCPMNAIVATLDNSPTNNAFSLLVERHAGYKQTLSEYYTSTSAKTWTRNYNNGAWGPWRQLAYTTDNAASATKLQTARTINGTSFDGTANITTAKWGTSRNIYIRDASQAHTGSAVSVDGSANEYLLLPSTITASLSGNASTATKLQTARTINGTSFDGTASITTAKWGTARNIYIRDASQAHTGSAVSVDGSANEYLLLPSTITASLSGNASTATKLQTARTIWGNSFNGSANIGGTLTPLADNTYDLGTTSRRWRYLFFYGYHGSWIAGKTRGVINIESQNSSTSTYFPYLRIESKYGDVFNIGMLQSTSESNNKFGIFRFASDRTANGTDSSFYMRGDGNMFGSGTLTMSGDVIAKSTSTAISDSELPIASASTLGLIKVGSGLKITNGVLSVTGISGGGSDVRFGLYDDNYVTLHVDNSYYELSRRRHKHSVTTIGSGNAVTSISFGTDGGMTLTKGSTFSLNGHTHSQYLTSHQTIYKLTIQKNGTTVGTYTPNVDSATINITTSGSGGGWLSGTYTDNGICRVNNSGGAGLAFWNDTEKTGLRVGGGNGIKGYSGNYGHLGNLFFNYVSSSVNVKVDAYGKIYSNGTALSSDLRLKEVVGYESDVLERMTKIPVIKFYRKDVGDNVQTTGFGAQSFQGIFDNVTIFNKDSGYYMISETSILGITFQGVKELYALQKQTTNEIDVLKQRIAILEDENQNLWNIINEMKGAA